MSDDEPVNAIFILQPSLKWLHDIMQFAERKASYDEPPGDYGDQRHSPQCAKAPRGSAVKWYEKQQLSQSKAAEAAGLSRAEFLGELSRFGVSPFQVAPSELDEELST